MLRGVDADALPEGLYSLKVHVEEASTRQKKSAITVAHDGHAEMDVEVTMDGRGVVVDLTSCDAGIRRVLDASKIDGQPAGNWLASADPRPARKACLLNLLASLRVRPNKSNDLLDLVQSAFSAFNDRAYMRVDRALLSRVDALVMDPNKPFYAEGEPKAAIHGRLLAAIPEPPDVKTKFGRLLSFRGEKQGPSLQMVIAVPPIDLPYTYVDFDLDQGNPLQDLAGFVVHMGELLGGKQTNHLDLRKKLAGTPAGAFLYYTLTS